MTSSTFRGFAGATTAVLLLGLVVASNVGSATAQPQGPPPSKVTVVNTPQEAVPVVPQGTTQVAGTVNVGNNPTVNVGNTPTVNVGNEVGTDDPLAGAEPFQTVLQVNWSGTNPNGEAEFDVPEGKTLLITFVSWRFDSNFFGTTLHEFSLRIVGQFSRLFPEIKELPSGAQIVSEEGRLLAPGGSTVRAVARVDNPPGPDRSFGAGALTISGYLLPE